MRRLTIIALFSLFSFSTVWAQTPKENLEKAVEIYNAAREYQDGLTIKTITDEQVGIIKSRMDQGIALLEKVYREGNADQVKVARYFQTNFQYVYFFTLGIKGKTKEAYAFNKQFETDMMRYTAADFPLSYVYFDKNYSIKWDNFAQTQAEYLTSFSEICYSERQYADAVRFARLALDHPAVSSFFKYIAVNKILESYEKNTTLLSNVERLNYNVQSVQMYDIQDEKSKETIKENNYPTAKKATTTLLAAAQIDDSPAMQIRCATVAPIAAKYENSRENAFKLFQYCYKNKYAASDEFHQSALQLAKTSFPSGTPEVRANAQNVGESALSALVAKVSSTNCEQLKQYSADYQALGLASKGLALDQQAMSCMKAREVAARKAEAARKKQIRRANRNFNVYLGIDAIPLMTSLEKMDFGGHLDIRGRRVAHSFGFSMVNLRKDYNSSRTKWDGNRFFYAFKIFTKDEAYSGLYFGYSDKTFENLISISAVKEDGSDPRFFNDFTPVDKQYELMWNSGMQALGKPFGVDFWFGIGASYNQLSFKEFDSPEGYTFSGNDFFDNRKKLESINLKMRMGVSIGLNFGKKR